MAATNAAVCFLLLLAVAVDSVVVEPRNIASGPPNVAVQVDQPVDFVLPCSSTNVPPTVRISWSEFISNTVSGSVISDGSTVLAGHPNSARYFIVTDNATRWDLRIAPYQLQDGGAYRCIDVNAAATPAFAQVISIATFPNCSSNIPPSGYVREDQYYTMECVVTYRGNVAPVMWFTGPEGTNPGILVTTNTTVWSGFQVNMTRYMNSYTFDLLANFTQEGFIQENYASNVPTWKYTYSSPILIVQWQPKNLYYVPLQTTYDVGQEILCHADANPSATYFWQNLLTTETWSTNRLYCSDALIGTQPMRCNAANNITGSMYTANLVFNLTVNPRTTTPTPTTTPTTTTAPAQAPCDNLSGRWLAELPTVVDMCLEINNTDHGRVIGLVRNATDPYFIEVRGRIVPNAYNQIGFTGIWPANIGTVTLIGTCRKCHGEELLVLNGLARTVTDNLSCENVGGTRLIANYVFRRTGPPCRGMLMKRH